jgi:hypothetical protein
VSSGDPASKTQQMARIDPNSIELTFWESVKNSNDWAEFQAYLNRYPAGVFSEVAKARIAAFQRGTAVSALGTQPSKEPPKPIEPSKGKSPELSIIDTQGLVSVLRDTLTNKEQRVQVSMVRASDGLIKWSTGDEFHADGRVEAVALGGFVARVVSGALWQHPLVVGASGSATVSIEGRTTRGHISWKVVSRSAGRARIEAFIEYRYDTANSSIERQTGKLIANFEDDLMLPKSFNISMRPNATSRLGGPEMFVGELPKD